MPSFGADEIIGKTLVGRVAIPIRRLPQDNAPVTYTASPGQVIGVVESYYKPTEGRSVLYWGFKDSNGRWYYSQHRDGIYDIRNLTDQGAQTTQQQTEAAANADKSWIDKLFDAVQKNLTTVLWIGAGILTLKTVLQNTGKNK